MTDLFERPAARALPDAVREQARTRILAELRPKRSRALLPLSIAAAAVVLVGGGIGLITMNVHDQPDGHHVAPAGPPRSSGVRVPSDHVAPELAFAVRQHSAPTAANARCVDARHSSDWSPIFTTSANDVDVIAYHTPTGPLFCEVTPTTVTLSGAAGQAGDAARPTFRTSFGTVAGVIGPDYDGLLVYGMQGILDAVVEDGVFVVPNGLSTRISSIGMTGLSADVPNRGGPLWTYKPPAITPAVTDRTVTPTDQTTPAAKRLTLCFTHSDAPPVVAPDAWTAGATTALTGDDSLLLGRFGNLLAVCEFRGTWVRLDVVNGTHQGTALLPTNRYAIATTVFETDNVAQVVGLTTSTQVTTVSVARQGRPTLTQSVHNGTFLFPNVNLDDYFTPAGPTVVRFMDAHNTVLAQLTAS